MLVINAYCKFFKISYPAQIFQIGLYNDFFYLAFKSLVYLNDKRVIVSHSYSQPTRFI